MSQILSSPTTTSHPPTTPPEESDPLQGRESPGARRRHSPALRSRTTAGPGAERAPGAPGSPVNPLPTSPGPAPTCCRPGRPQGPPRSLPTAAASRPFRPCQPYGDCVRTAGSAGRPCALLRCWRSVRRAGGQRAALSGDVFGAGLMASPAPCFRPHSWYLYCSRPPYGGCDRVVAAMG